ncbi:MAG: hypothetical protein P1V21_07805 [Rhizobiaceae bacterium]|nr:hypothetical protein [Rhizobiaceae bacterium]
MKYKNIPAAIHNLGDSFLSSMNYIDGGYVIDDMTDIHQEGHGVSIDWIRAEFHPKSRMTDRIGRSLEYYHAGLANHFHNLNVDLSRLESVTFCWPVKGRKSMEATDDRGKHYKIYVREFK